MHNLITVHKCGAH